MDNQSEMPLESNSEVRPTIDITPSDIIESKPILAQESKETDLTKIGEENKSPKFTRRQEAFIGYIVEGYSNTESARLAKFSAKDPSRVANYLLKRPEIVQEISRRKEELHKAVMMDKPSFILMVQKHLKEAKQEGTKAKLLELYAKLLGYNKEDAQQQINIFGAIDKAESFFKPSNTPS